MNKNKIENDVGQFVRGSNESTVYVGNLRYTLNAGDIKHIFSRFGKVGFVRVVVDPKTKKNKGIAFVQMSNKEEAQKAVKSLNGSELKGRTLKVSIALNNHFYESKSPVFNTKKSKKTKAPKAVATVKKKVRRRRKSSGLDKLFTYLNGK